MGIFEEYKNRIDQDITNQEDPNTIPPETVGKRFKELADITKAQVAVGPGIDMGIATPTMNPGALTDPAKWDALESGVYTHFGGVELIEGNIGKIYFDGTNFELTQSPVPQPANKIDDWTAAPYTAGDQVNHKGQVWEAAVNTSGVQEPGVVAVTIWKPVIDKISTEQFKVVNPVLAMVDVSPNLINYKTDFEGGGYNPTTAAKAASNNQLRTDIIPVDPAWIGQEMTLSGFGFLPNTLPRIMGTNGVGTIIQSVPGAGDNLDEVTFTPAVGWVDIRIIIANIVGIGLTPTNNQFVDTLQLELSGEATPQKPYGGTIEYDRVMGLDANFSRKAEVVAVNSRVDTISLKSNNFLNAAAFQSGSFNATGGTVASANWLRGIAELPEDIDDFILSGHGGISAANPRAVITDENQAVLEVIYALGASNTTDVPFTKPEGAKYAKVNIANVVGIGSNPTNNQFTNAVMLRDASKPSDFMPFGELVDGKKVYGLPKSLKYNLDEIIVKKSSATSLFIYYHEGGTEDTWLRLNWIRTTDPVKFIDTWRLGEVWICKRTSDLDFTTQLLVVNNGMWENAIYVGGGGYTDALGGIHGWEQLVETTLMLDNKVINPAGSETVWRGEWLQACQNSKFKKVSGVGDNGISLKMWELKSGWISIGNDIEWLFGLTPGWNSYLAMLPILRKSGDGLTQITHTAIPNDDMKKYDVSEEGFTTAIANPDPTNGPQNPKRDRIIIFGDRIMAEMHVEKREVTLNDGTFLPKGFANAGMYVQNTALYNKVYAGFGGHTVGIGEVWKTKFKVRLSAISV